jgi:hypothetical protein
VANERADACAAYFCGAGRANLAHSSPIVGWSSCYGRSEGEPGDAAVKKKQKQTILTKVQIATTEVSESVDELDKLLSDLKSAPRAQKTTISKIVEDAFLRLKNARVALIDVEKLVKKEKEEE